MITIVAKDLPNHETAIIHISDNNADFLIAAETHCFTVGLGDTMADHYRINYFNSEEKAKAWCRRQLFTLPKGYKIKWTVQK